MDLLIATLKQPSHLVIQVTTIIQIYNNIMLTDIVAVQPAAAEKKSLPAQTGTTFAPQMNSPLMLIESFLQALTNADKDGRIVITKKGGLLLTNNC